MSDNYINDQSSLNTTKGSYGSHGSIANNGCGAIAITNVCLMDDMENINLDEIIKRNLAKQSGVVLGGALGTNPMAIKRVLEDLGFKVRYLGSWRNLEQVKLFKYFIVLYTWVYNRQLGMHYQAGRVLSDGQFELFNPYRKYKDVATFKQGENAICPLIFGIK